MQFEEFKTVNPKKASPLKLSMKESRQQRVVELDEAEMARRKAEARGEFQRAKEAKKPKALSLRQVYQPTERELDQMEMKKEESLC